MASRRELGTRLAIITAAEKAVRAAKEQIRSEARAMMRAAYDEDGISSLDLLVGDEKVGRLGLSKPSVGVYADGGFDEWATERGMGHRTMTVDLTGVEPERIEELVELVSGAAIPYEVECHADETARKSLAVRNGRVVDMDGEIVPGTYAKTQDIRVTGCKPEDVGPAMALAGDGTTLAGLLTGGDE